MKMLLGLGGNLGDVNRTMDEALAAIAALPGTRVLRQSGRYRTTPVGVLDQPDFLNAVIEIDTALSPRAMLGACLGIEAALHRLRTIKNGPRVIDLDLLLADGEQHDDPELTLPHPRMRERAFVLVPLLDLYPDGQVYGYDLAASAAAVGRDGVWPI